MSSGCGRGRSRQGRSNANPEDPVKRILTKAYPVAALLFLLWVGFEWLRAESAVGHQFQGVPDGGIYGHP